MPAAFITGASRGLGYGFAEALLAKGWQVFGGVRHLDTALPRHAKLTWVTMDVTDDVSIERAAQEVSQQVNTLELLINNAGVNKDTATRHHLEKVSVLGSLERGDLQTMFDTNSISPLMVLQHFLPLLISTPSFVINISSYRASFHNEIENEYANYGYRASKIALNMITACSVQDLPKTVRTFAVNPGSVRTDMNPSGEYDPRTQAEKILAITESWNDAWNGQFLKYDSTPYWP